jgi:hypothetical protein
MKVELIYNKDCHNLKDARAQLLRAFVQAGIAPKWEEWSRDRPESPDYVYRYGSPTILVNSFDVADSPNVEADCCRLYKHENGNLRGVPSVEEIKLALIKAKDKEISEGERVRTKNNWNSVLAVVPSIGIALLPKLTCPLCWPAYTAILATFGLGFVNYTPYLIPLTFLFLVITLVSLVYKARGRQGYMPFVLGLIGSTLLISGKFILNSNPAMYGGISLLLAASVWNSSPRRGKETVPCPSCASEKPQSKTTKNQRR